MVPGICVNTGCRFVLGNKRLVGPKGWSDILGPTHRGHRMERQRPPLAVVFSYFDYEGEDRGDRLTTGVRSNVNDAIRGSGRFIPLESLAHQEFEHFLPAWLTMTSSPSVTTHLQGTSHITEFESFTTRNPRLNTHDMSISFRR